MNRTDLLVVPLAAIVVMIVNVAISFAMVWTYSSFVNPGQSADFYEAFAMQAAPISSVIAGIPLMFIAGMLIAKRRRRQRALLVAGAVALLYIVVDTAALLSVGSPPRVWAWAALSHITKLLAALAGAGAGARNRSAGDELALK